MTDDTHHSTEQDLIQHRLNKLERIRERGDEPFKYTFARSCVIGSARANYEAAEAEGLAHDAIDLSVALAGRMTAFRSHGNSSFADLRDGFEIKNTFAIYARDRLRRGPVR